MRRATLLLAGLVGICSPFAGLQAAGSNLTWTFPAQLWEYQHRSLIEDDPATRDTALQRIIHQHGIAPNRVANADRFYTQFSLNSAHVSSDNEDKIRCFAATTPATSTVFVTGYTDRTGEHPVNLELSRVRAQAVARILREANPQISVIIDAASTWPDSLRGDADPLARRVDIVRLMPLQPETM